MMATPPPLRILPPEDTGSRWTAPVLLESFAARRAAPSSVPSSPSSPSSVGSSTATTVTPTKPSKPLSALRRFGKNLTVTTKHLPNPVLPEQKLFRRLQDCEKITDTYDILDEIHSPGANSKVLVAKRKADGTNMVIKVRSKRFDRGGEASWRMIMTQMYNLKGSRHVLDITEIVEDSRKFYVVMPKCDGGELYTFLMTEAEVPESECKRIIREIATAVGHLHEGGLVHRDLKPENIMFHTEEGLEKSPRSVKLIDFDTCHPWEPKSPRGQSFVGTPGYIAPEALLGEITPQSDLWSIGVILYILMTAEMPWTSIPTVEDGTVGSPSATKMYKALKEEVVDWEREPWPTFPMARDLCQRLMAFHVEERLSSVKEVLAHGWLAEE